MTTQRLLEPLLSTCGQLLSDFGGVRITRLTENLSTGAARLPVERTAGMPATGQVLLDGVLYHYRAIAGLFLDGIFTRQQGTEKAGTVQPHTRLAAVTDATGTYSQLDALRASYFLASASGEDLSVCGRNYGLSRDPAIADDDTYRRSLLSIAYGPRGTVWGLQTALDAMLGPGRYTLTEDPDNCQVQISTPRSQLLAQSHLGHTYLSAESTAAATAGAVPLPEGIQSIYSVFWAPQSSAAECRTALPSATPPWAYGGADGESTGAALATDPANAGTQLRSADACYVVPARLGGEGDATLSAVLVPQATAAANEGDLCLSIADGSREMRLCLRRKPLGHVVVLVTTDGEQVAVSPLPSGTAAEVAIVKQGRSAVTVQVGGGAVLSAAYDRFPATTQRRLRVGSVAGKVAGGALLQRLALSVHDRRNYACAQGEDAYFDAARPQTLITQQEVFTAADVGKYLTVAGSRAQVVPPGAPVPRSGSNDGKYTIVAVDANDTVRLSAGSFTAASVGGTPGQASRLDAAEAVFRYPEDVGKEVVIKGGSNAAGTYIVAQVLGPDNLAYALPYPATGAAVLLRRDNGSSPSFAPRNDLSFDLLPRFADETGVAWQLADAGEIGGTAASPSYAPRQALPDPAGDYVAACNTVPGGTVLYDELPAAKLVQAGPPAAFSVYPFYVSDPFSFVQNYLSQLTAAGIKATLTLT